MYIIRQDTAFASYYIYSFSMGPSGLHDVSFNVKRDLAKKFHSSAAAEDVAQLAAERLGRSLSEKPKLIVELIG